MEKFEQQLVYSISIESKKRDRYKIGKKGEGIKGDDRKKYCLDYNRGSCSFTDSHEGKLQGQLVWKLHVCKRCLVQEGVEAKHSEKECPKQK